MSYTLIFSIPLVPSPLFLVEGPCCHRQRRKTTHTAVGAGQRGERRVGAGGRRAVQGAVQVMGGTGCGTYDQRLQYMCRFSLRTADASPPRPHTCAQVLRDRGACPCAPAADAAAPSHAAWSTSCRALRGCACRRERRLSGGETAAGDGRGQWQQGFGAPPGVAAARRDSWRQGEERGEGGFMH